MGVFMSIKTTVIAAGIFSACCAAVCIGFPERCGEFEKKLQKTASLQIEYATTDPALKDAKLKRVFINDPQEVQEIVSAIDIDHIEDAFTPMKSITVEFIDVDGSLLKRFEIIKPQILEDRTGADGQIHLKTDAFYKKIRIIIAKHERS